MIRRTRVSAAAVGVAIAAMMGSGCRRAAPAPAPRGAGPALQIVGDSVKHRLGDPLPQTSALFDGHTVHLRAARGETLGVQVLRKSDAKAAIALTLQAHGVTVQPFAVGFADVRAASTGSMYGPSRGPGRYPDRLTPTQGPLRGPHDAYFDVAVAAGTPPGRYHGVLAVGGTDYPVSLKVEPVTIDIHDDPLVWAYYDPRDIARAQGVAAGSPAAIAWELKYDELFRRHGVYMASDLPVRDFRKRLALMDDSIRYWPVYLRPKHMAADVRTWVKIFRHRPQIPFTIPIDEPRALMRKLKVICNGKLIHAAGGGPGRLLHAVTDRARPGYGDAVDVFISPDSIPPPANARRGAQFWTYNGRPPEAGSMLIDTTGVALRTWGWIAVRYHIPLWYAWEALYFTDRFNGATQPTDLVSDPITFDERRKGGTDFGNGDGLLVYPGPRPSLRLEALRRGLEDRLLLRKLAACGGRRRADAIARQVIPRALAAAGSTPSWPATEPGWERARNEILDALVARCPDAR